MNNRDVAIVGMECVVPGAHNRAEYWNNLVEGVDAIRDVPAGRLNGRDGLPAWIDAQIPCNRGGFLPDDLRFEPMRFGIMPNIVPHGDPDQFLMLHVIDGALADAGIGDDDPLRRSCDVIIGRGGYITNKMSEIYYRCDLLHHLLDYLVDRFPQLQDSSQREQFAEELRWRLPQSDVDNISTCIPNLVASRVANRLNLCGAAYTVDAACASSLLSVEQAVERLRLGLCQVAVASGIFLCQTPTFWYIFTQLGAMSPSFQIRPFDRRADGLLVGEGAGAVVLKRLDDAVCDGNEIYAVIKGAGAASDGRQTHILASSSTGQIEALRRAYRDAQLDPATIGYLEAHGTGTIVGDLAELQTIKDFWGHRDKFPPVRAMGSVKSMIGHMMPAAGIASLIKTALSLSNKTLLPSLHCEQPHEELADAPFYINRETRPWIHAPGRHPRRAGINAFGFGGINVHLVLEEATERIEMEGRRVRCRPHCPGRRPTELVLFSGASRQELLGRLQEVSSLVPIMEQGYHWRLASAGKNTGETPVAPVRVTLHDLAATLADQLDFGNSYKLALVCSDFEQLRQLLAKCIAGLTQDDAAFDNENVYFSAAADRPKGKLCGIFPGVGFPGLIGTYPNHLMDLCRFFPEVREEFDGVERRDEHPEDPVPTSLIFLPPTTLSDDMRLQLRNRIAAMKVIEGEEVEGFELPPWERNIAAPCVTLSSWVSWRLLEKLEVPVDMVCGQSQGEIAAMCAAGILRFGEVVPRFWKGLKVSPNYARRGRLAFIVASEERLVPYLAEAPDTTIAIHVAPEMLIIGGSNEHLYDLAARLRSQGLIANLLPYPPIHTPRLAHMRGELLQLLDLDLLFRKPAMTIYSAITESPFPDDIDVIRDLALSNLDRPVRFWQTVHRMYDAGARVFLQVGGGTMASNIKTILPRPDVLGPAVDLDHRHPLTQLQHMCAALFTAGIRFHPAYLYQYPPPRKLDLSKPDASTPAAALALPLRMDWVPLPKLASECPSERSIGHPERSEGSDVNPSVPPAEILHCDQDDICVRDVVSAQENQGIHDVAPWTDRLPMLGKVLDRRPGESITTRRVLTLEHDLFLHDHAVIDPGSCKSIENRMAILPMAFILETAAETAVSLFPHLGVIGVEKVAAMRWIDFPDIDTVELEIHGRLASADPETGVHRVAVEILAHGKPNASATVLLSDSYREDVRLQFSPLSHPRPWPLTAEDIYTERHMFHGPRFRCVSDMQVLGDEGLIGEITLQPREDLFDWTSEPLLVLDPVVLDGVVQLVAMWVIVNGAFLMPAKITKLELYRPSPPPGTRVPVRVEIRNVDSQGRTVTADVEVEDGEGHVWFRVEGVNEWLYEYSPRLQDTHRLPTRYHLAEPLQLPGAPPDSVTALVSSMDLRHSNKEWLCRLYLTQEEWLYFKELPTLHKQLRWLMGRIAAKDAARIWMAAATGTEMLHPALLAIAVDEAGKPYACPLVGELPVPEISIAHTDRFAVALAAPASCGIDLEPRDREVRSVLTSFANKEEIGLLDAAAALADDPSWPLRLWCAKEAVAKTIGSGLQGRPMDFEMIDVDEEGQLLIQYRPTLESYVVRTCLDDTLVYAHTSAGDIGPQSGSVHEFLGDARMPSQRSLP